MMYRNYGPKKLKELINKLRNETSMRKYSTKEFNWVGDNYLFIGNSDTGFAIAPVEEGFWRVRWPDGILSKDYYNKTRAKENCMTAALEYKQYQLEAGE